MLTRSGSSFRSLIRWRIRNSSHKERRQQQSQREKATTVTKREGFLLPRLDPWQHLSVVCDLNFVFPASGAMFNRSLILKMSLPAFLWKAKFIHMGESGAREVSKTVANVLTKGFSIPTYDAFLSSCTLHSIFLMGLTGEMRKWEKY